MAETPFGHGIFTYFGAKVGYSAKTVQGLFLSQHLYWVIIKVCMQKISRGAMQTYNAELQ